MLGSFFLGGGRFEVREMGDLAPGPGEVRVRVAACGVCGTDVHIYHGSKGSADVTPPVVLGHEFAGVVEAVGEGADLVAVGDHVAVDPNMYCGRCRPCRTGRKQLCTGLRAYGVNRNGGFAEACVVRQEQCHRVAPDIPLELAALAEPVACAVHGIDRCHIRHGDVVCVVGGGAIGLVMVQLARLAGAACVILSEPIAFRRDLGLRLGADAAVDPVAENLPARIRDIAGCEGADVVVECVGNRIALAQALAACGRGATLMVFAVHTPGEIAEIPPFDIFSKELTITGSLINPDTHSRATELISARRLDLAPLVTHSFGIDHVEDAIRMQMGNESVKVVVRPEKAG